MRWVSIVVTCLLLTLVPAAAPALVTFGRIDQLVAQPGWPVGLKEALDSHPRIAGTTFDGWGTHRIELYYEGDAADFAAFMKALREVDMSGIGSDGQVCPVEHHLALSPGRGRFSEHAAKLCQIEKPFDYDWSVDLVVMYDDQASRAAPFIATINDSQGRTVKRRIARGLVYTPNLQVVVSRYVGDGATLSETEVPLDWLFNDDSNAGRKPSIYLKRPDPDDSPADADQNALVAEKRIEQFQNHNRILYRQAQEAWRLSEFYGITVDLAWQPKSPAAVTATYDGAAAQFDVATGKQTSSGEFPAAARTLVERWIAERRDEIVLQWKAATGGDPIELLDPLE
ncbi:MAG: DUF4160 domain-containing protein [Planctomycetaceae bacterium]